MYNQKRNPQSEDKISCLTPSREGNLEFDSR